MKNENWEEDILRMKNDEKVIVEENDMSEIVVWKHHGYYLIFESVMESKMQLNDIVTSGKEAIKKIGTYT
jgi:hypothetical protein